MARVRCAAMTSATANTSTSTLGANSLINPLPRFPGPMKANAIRSLAGGTD
jgi:hypothetical protein